MAITRERRRGNTEGGGGAGGEGGVDRLSNLPEDVLHHIFSFLDTKHAVQASVLSKKWRKLWTSLPHLNFHSEYFRLKASYKKFVLKVLSKRDRHSPVNEILFCPRPSLDRYLITRVIKYAMSHQVETLSLDLGYRPQRYVLRQAFPTCPSLKTLEICCCDFSTQSFGFSRLTSLHLESCSFCHGSDVFANCPNLDTLSLVRCYFRRFKVLKISCPKLTDLTVEGMYYSFESLCDGCKVEICAPKLTNFSYLLSHPVDFSAINLPSLEYAEINVCHSYNMNPQNCFNSFKLLQGIYNAQTVILSPCMIMSLSKGLSMLEGQASPFSRLKFLRLNLFRGYNPSILPENLMTYLLGGSPSAKTVFHFLKD